MDRWCLSGTEVVLPKPNLIIGIDTAYSDYFILPVVVLRKWSCCLLLHSSPTMKTVGVSTSVIKATRSKTRNERALILHPEKV